MNSGSAEPHAVRVVLRPHLWRRPEVLALSLFAAVSICTWRSQSDPGPLWASVLAVALIAAARWPGRLWLLITGQEVSCSPRLVRTADAHQAVRDEVLAVEVWRNRVVFSGENGDAVLSLRPCWTLAQCGAMAAHLGVPLVRHRGRRGRLPACLQAPARRRPRVPAGGTQRLSFQVACLLTGNLILP